MASVIPLLVFVILGAGVVYIRWRLQRERPTDQPTISRFAKQYGLRVLSATRSFDPSNDFRYLFRGLNLSSTARFYDIAAEDADGKRGDIHVAFDSLFTSEQLRLLDTQGLTLVPASGSENATRPDSAARPSTTWCGRLVMFGAGAAINGFIFSGILHRYLSPPNRPVLAMPSFGYTVLYKASYGNAYGTHFEYFAVTYGVWSMWSLFIVSGLLSCIWPIQATSRERSRRVLVAAAISMLLYVAIWQLCVYGGRS
jgi:hypothetical protein